MGSRIRRAGRRAFTLIELLIVIAILLAIGGLVAVNVMSSKDKTSTWPRCRSMRSTPP